MIVHDLEGCVRIKRRNRAADRGQSLEFTGQERDTESGLDNFKARYVSAPQGRFQSPDPLGMFVANPANPPSWNLYAYVMNNPLKYIDPTGTDCTAEGWDDGQGDTCAAIPQVTIPDNSVTVDAPIEILPLVWFPLPNPGGASGGSLGDSGTPSFQNGQPGQASRNCAGSSTIISGSVTTNVPTIAAGAAIGGLIGGPPGAFVGGLMGSFFGVGGNVSYVPSTNSLYAGPTAIFGLGLGGGSGQSANLVNVPSTQDANSIAKGLSYSITYQPNLAAGSTVTKSPGSGPPVVGPSIGNRIPVAVGASYNISLHNGGCQ
jgi:RHS repeat-associated protein